MRSPRHFVPRDDNMKILPLSEKHYQGVFDLIKTFSDEYVMLPKSFDEVKNTAKDFRVVLDGDKVLACAMLDQFTDTLAEVKSLAVAKTAQGKGLGALLVADCEQRAKELGMKKLFALTFQDKFFHNLGYKTVEMESLPEKVYRECVRCHYYNDCKEIAVIKNI